MINNKKEKNKSDVLETPWLQIGLVMFFFSNCPTPFILFKSMPLTHHYMTFIFPTYLSKCIVNFKSQFECDTQFCKYDIQVVFNTEHTQISKYKPELNVWFSSTWTYLTFYIIYFISSSMKFRVFVQIRFSTATLAFVKIIIYQYCVAQHMFLGMYWYYYL